MSFRSNLRKKYIFFMIITLLITVFIGGGSSRHDVPSLIVLRPLSIIFCLIGLWSLTREHVRDYQGLFLIFAGAIILIVTHLVPLPPPIWSCLPGRKIIADVDAASGIVDAWRPISMVPAMTVNALYALATPLAALILLVQLNGSSRVLLAELFVAFGLVSLLLGVAQITGGTGIPTALFAYADDGSPIGFFANRNHQAVFLSCLFPLIALAVFNDRRRNHRSIRVGVAGFLAALMIMLVLVAGSRAGLVTAAVGLASGVWIASTSLRAHSRSLSPHQLQKWVTAGGGALVILIGLAMIFSRAEAVQRLLGGAGDDLRFSFWGPVASAIGTYFPVGSGVGTFADVYKIGEPNALLSPLYLNHAHNEALEILLTGGAPGALLLAIACIGGVWAVGKALLLKTGDADRRNERRAGAAIVTMLGFASLVDYPLRVPSLSVVAIFAGVLLVGTAVKPQKDQ